MDYRISRECQAGVAQIRNRHYNTLMTREEIQNITLCADKVFHGGTIRQEYPVCECGKMYSEKELYNAPGVYFKQIDVFGKSFTLIEPVCPICKQKIPAHFNVLN